MGNENSTQKQAKPSPKSGQQEGHEKKAKTQPAQVRTSPRGQKSPRAQNSPRGQQKSPRGKKPPEQPKQQAQQNIPPAPKAAEEQVGKFSTTLLQKGQKKGISKSHFKILRVLGQGSYGKVCQVEYLKNGKIYAMKIIKKDNVFKKNQEEHTKAERRIMERIDHPFIVSLRYAFQTPTKLYLVTDFYNGGELFFHLRNARGFEEPRCIYYVAEVILAMELIHSLDIIYRDLKPENCLLDDQGHIKVTDFGLSKEGVDLPNGTKTFCGTPEYLAPEVIAGRAYGKPIDIWHLGNFAYEIIKGRPPFATMNRNDLYVKIMRTQPRFNFAISEEYRDFIMKCLNKDPDTRITLSELKGHPVFANIDWEKLYRKEIPPPFVPDVKSSKDISNFDDEYTQLPPRETPVTTVLNPQQQNAFEGFTYEGNNPMN